MVLKESAFVFLDTVNPPGGEILENPRGNRDARGNRDGVD
jgi:hypothetical protein